MITPWYKGDTSPAWTIQLTPDSGVFSTTGLSTSNFSLIIRNVDSVPPTDTAGTGSFSNLVAGTSVSSPSTITYAPGSADVANLGDYILLVVVTYPGSGATQTFNLGSWQVIAK
jgi:hypothetical protein